MTLENVEQKNKEENGMNLVGEEAEKFAEENHLISVYEARRLTN